MRKAVLMIATSLDGFIAEIDGGVDWLGGEDKDYQGNFGMAAFMSKIDTIILGQTTYRQIITELSPDGWPYQGKQTYVFTNQDEADNENAKFISSDIGGFIGQLKNQAGKDIWICGGASIVNQLIKVDLIDEYQISVMPIVLGQGIRLFEDDNPTHKLHLEQITSENGVAGLIYSRKTD